MQLKHTKWIAFHSVYYYFISTKAMTQHSSSDSGSDQEFLDALDSTGTRYKIKVRDKTAMFIPTVRPDSNPESDKEGLENIGVIRQPNK